MAASTIKIKFTEDLVLNDRLLFVIQTQGDLTLNWYQYYKFVNVRGTAYEVSLGEPISGSYGERNAINFKQAFELDNASFISSGVISVTRDVNEVTIIAPNTDTFILFTLENIVPGISTDPSIDIVIVDGSFDPFNIDSVGFSESISNPCQNINVEVETSILATKILSPVSVDPNTENPFSFSWLRGQTFNLIVEDSDGNQEIQVVTTPSILSPDDFILQVNNAPNGTTLIAENSIAVGLEFEYSLDNSTWQTSNVFDSLVPGEYTLYIKDQLGCSTTRTFTASEYGITTPYFNISKSNSIRFAERINFGDAGNYKTDENTLSCEVDVKLPWHEVQLFQTADVITTQFKSNYEVNEAKIIKEDGNEVDLLIVKKSNYIGNKDLRDARKYDLGDGKTGIYFTSGAIYNYDTGIPTAETHYLNGGLPVWAKSGNFVKVDTEWYLIEDVLYDDSKNAEILVITNNYIGLDVSVVAGSIFNIFDYEIYEFQIDMVDYIDSSIRVSIHLEDEDFGEISLISEEINVQVKHEDTLLIEYWNNDNTDLFYATGIKNRIRIPYTRKDGDVIDDSEINKTDTTSVLISSELYELDEFKFEPVSKEIWRKLMIALSHKNVLIDGVSYLKNDNFDFEGPLEETNLYVLTAKMIKTGGVFISQSDGIIDFNTTSSEIPGLLDAGSGGFIKYN